MIEIGEYIRTKKGQIDRLQLKINIDNWRSKDLYGNIIARCENDTYKLEDITKHSKNIIELIEIGDILEVFLPNINTELIVPVDKYFKDSMILSGIMSKNVILKRILTKEQFMQNCYEVEES